MTDDKVTPVDFGKEHNEAVARFARLMGIVEEHYEDVRRNPIKHLNEASDEIMRLRRALWEAENAYKDRMSRRFLTSMKDHREPPRKFDPDTRVVFTDEWEALKAAYEVVKAARADDGLDTKNLRTIKLTLTVAKPEALELRADIPADLTPSGEVELRVA